MPIFRGTGGSGDAAGADAWGRTSAGNGGSSYWGGGGRGIWVSSNLSGESGRAYGSGGGGAANPSGASTGGTGKGGVVVIEEFF